MNHTRVASRGHTGNDLLTEHTVVLRMWGRLQNELGQRMQQLAAEHHQMQAEVLRLRAALVVARTAALWGMGLSGNTPERRRMPKRSAHEPLPTTPKLALDEVLCQTACVGHAHPWLADDQGCTRTGQPCHRVHLEEKH